MIEDRLVDIVAGGYDAGIRLSEIIDRDVVQVRLTEPARFVVVGTPEYLARHGTPKRPEDLLASEGFAAGLITGIAILGHFSSWHSDRLDPGRNEIAEKIPVSQTMCEVAESSQLGRSMFDNCMHGPSGPLVGARSRDRSMTTVRNKPFKVIVLGLGLIACRGQAAEVTVAAPAPTRVTPAASSGPNASKPEFSKATFDSFPQDVLVGTDVEKLSDDLAKRAPIRFPSTYVGEQGGATASLQIRLQNGKASMSRTFKEPGTRAQKAEYPALAVVDGGQRLSGPEVEIVGVQDGVIVLERRSGVDGIPPSLWVFYEQKRAKPAKVK